MEKRRGIEAAEDKDAVFSFRKFCIEENERLDTDLRGAQSFERPWGNVKILLAKTEGPSGKGVIKHQEGTFMNKSRRQGGITSRCVGVEMGIGEWSETGHSFLLRLEETNKG